MAEERENEASSPFVNSLRIKPTKRFHEPGNIEEVVVGLGEVGEFYRRRESHDRNDGCEWCRQFLAEQSRRGDGARASLPSVGAVHVSGGLFRWRRAVS
jgi:hypothetical protein